MTSEKNTRKYDDDRLFHSMAWEVALVFGTVAAVLTIGFLVLRQVLP